jgi:general secretion pathway protein A
MYVEYYALKEFPFLSSPDARYLYLSDQVNETLQKCLYMVSQRIGPLYVYGPIGTGKTTLAKRLLDQLGQQANQFTVAFYVVPPQYRLNAFLRKVMDEFGVKTARSYDGSLSAFTNWLLDQHRAGVKPVLVLDEAQNLTPGHLKLLHFLLNYETSREKLLQLVLFGQNELAQKIERFPELKSRMYPSALAALNREDTKELIAFRWFVAGGKELPFGTDAIDEVFRATLGLPREIVKACDLALLRAYSLGRRQVLPEDVQVAAEELRLHKD